MKILITAPSLNEDENVSGIASLVRGIIARGKNEYVHFAAGRRDGEGLGLRWFFKQAFMLPLYRRTVRRVLPDIVHVNTSFEPRSIIRDMVLAYATPKNVPVLLHIHGGRFLLEEFPDPTLAGRADLMLKTANKILVLSDAERASLLRRTPGLDIHVLPNAVSANDIPFIERSGGVKTILYFGRIDMRKGLPDIVNASRQLVERGSDFRFVCCGTGPDEHWFTTEMRRVLGERFEHCGVVKGEEKWRVFSSADIFLLPSTFEGLPIALLEAMAAGCIPVVTDVGAMAEAVEDGVTGFVVEPDNLEQLVDRLRDLLSKDESELAEMRKMARATIEENYDMANYVVRLEDLYASMITPK